MTDKEILLRFLKTLEPLIQQVIKDLDGDSTLELKPVKVPPIRTMMAAKKTIKDVVFPNNIDPSNDAWPLAVPEESIVTTHIQKTTRATMMASKLPRLSGKCLDFGCGEGYLTEHLHNKGVDVLGYDIKFNDEWANGEKPVLCTDEYADIAENKYDFIILYDVIDHIVDESIDEVIQKVKSLLAPNGTVCLFAHPWTSTHGGHLYEMINKAYIHMFLDEEQLNELYPNRTHCVKIIRPMAHYKSIIEDRFNVKSKKVVSNTPNSWVVEHLVPVMYKNVFEEKMTLDQVIKIISVSGIYYELTNN